jgi:D-alanine-D-alanine ligase
VNVRLERCRCSIAALHMTPPDENPPRLRVAVIYGGRSTEYEISLQSAASVVAQLDRSRYEIVPIHVDQRGAFHHHQLPAADRTPSIAGASQPLFELPADAGAPSLALAARAGQLFEEAPAAVGGKASLAAAGGGELLGATGGTGRIDVVFPVMHGPLCEDGSIQGLLELADVPYVGSRVLGSAVCMDKDVAKRLVRAEGIAVVPYLTLRAAEWERSRPAFVKRVEAELGFPAFVKPATLGSSVGVSRARDGAELSSAIALALRYDDKLLIEEAVNAREIEYAVLAAEDEGAPPLVSVPGEIAPADAFYSFERKYLDEQGAALYVPAELDPQTREKGELAARRIFQTLECDGMARVDFFLDRQTGELYFNEVNTLPGFTAISMYPKLWEASGLSYPRLLDRLIDDARRRHARRSKLQRER